MAEAGGLCIAVAHPASARTAGSRANRRDLNSLCPTDFSIVSQTFKIFVISNHKISGVLSNGCLIFYHEFCLKIRLFGRCGGVRESRYRNVMRLRIGIAGITGRMGKLLVDEVAAVKALCSGGTSRHASGAGALPAFQNVAALAAVSDLVIDFTSRDTVVPHAAALAAAGIPWVLGTTGLDGSDQAAVAAAASKIPIIAAPNFSPGVNLVLALARQLAAALPAASFDAEILEMHHRQKRDAPSGTALALGEAVADGRGVTLADVMATARHGETGPRAAGEIGFASLRGGQIFGSHSLIMTAADEQITLTHHAFDRRIFASGAVRAALWLHAKPPGLYTMADVLGL
jgi:4-hydroxy-tetrahydrodipicolinate reductase